MIYVIEQGSYSDYRVVGVFSTRENAEQILNMINTDDGSDKATIAEWQMDPGIEELNKGLKPWNICMDYHGKTEQVYLHSDQWKAYGLHVWARTQAPHWQGRPISDAVSGVVWAKDEKHAVKIANEYRAQAIAENRLTVRE